MLPEFSRFRSRREALRALNAAVGRVPGLLPLTLGIIGVASWMAFWGYVAVLQPLRLPGEIDALFVILSVGLSTVLIVFLLLNNFIRRDLRRQLREAGHLLCPDCGYDLQGLPSEICPECGCDTTRIYRRYPLVSYVLVWVGVLFGVSQMCLHGWFLYKGPFQWRCVIALVCWFSVVLWGVVWTVMHPRKCDVLSDEAVTKPDSAQAAVSAEDLPSAHWPP